MMYLNRFFTFFLAVFFLVIFFQPCYGEQCAGNNFEVRARLTRATVIDEDSIEFSPGNQRGLQLRPGQAIEMVIPAEFVGRYPDYAYIEHRKEYFYSEPDEEGIDPNDAQLRTDFFDSASQTWYSWADQFGPLKRAAVRPPARPKKNTLYNLRENVGSFSPAKVRIVNVGTGQTDLTVASFHKLGLVFLHQRKAIPADTTFFQDFIQTNCLLIKYSLDLAKGLTLRPKQSFEFILPENFQHRPIFHMILKHRKDPQYAADPQNFDAYDPDAAYILCEVRDRKSGFWHKWADRSSLKKFSEVRTADNPENETLHNCLRTFGQIEPDRIRLTNVGSGDPTRCIANVHELEILFAPDVALSHAVSEIFTPETEFNQPQQQRPVPLLGGGPRLGGKFPGALILGANHLQRQAKILALPDQYRFSLQTSGENCRVNDNGDLLIDLPAGHRLEALEMALGDLDITSLEMNKDGYFGRSGKAIADAWIERNGKKLNQLLQQNNIGMAGMVVCGGPTADYISKEGDRIKVVISNDNAFLMGYRLLLQQKP